MWKKLTYPLRLFLWMHQIQVPCDCLHKTKQELCQFLNDFATLSLIRCRSTIGVKSAPTQRAHLRLLVFDPVGLVDDQVPPVELLEHGLLPDEHLVGGHAGVPFSRQQHVPNEGVLKTAAEQPPTRDLFDTVGNHHIH